MSPRALGGLAVALMLAGCRGGGEPAPAQAPGPTSVFEGVEVVGEDPDGTRWRLQAARGVGREAEATGSLEGVAGTLTRGGRTLTLAAGAADAATSGEIRLWGGVEVHSGGYRARAARATYRRGEGRVVSEDPVEVEGPGLTVHGRGLEVDVEGRSVRVLDGVRAVLRRGGS